MSEEITTEEEVTEETVAPPETTEEEEPAVETEEPPPVETEEEPEPELKFGRPKNVGNLEALKAFEYEGEVYTRRRITGAGVVCLAVGGDKLITLPCKTKVKPVIEEEEENGDD